MLILGNLPTTKAIWLGKNDGIGWNWAGKGCNSHTLASLLERVLSETTLLWGLL
jgi:hypothetical protein